MKLNTSECDRENFYKFDGIGNLKTGEYPTKRREDKKELSGCKKNKTSKIKVCHFLSSHPPMGYIYNFLNEGVR